MNNDKLAYVSSSIIPSKSANSVHVMKMCNALAGLGVKVDLFCYGNNDGNNSSKSYREFYDVDSEFRIEKSARLNWFKLNSVVYALNIFVKLFRFKGIILARDFLCAVLLSLSGKSVSLELHDASILHSRIKRFLFFVYRKSAGFNGVIFITKALEEKFLNSIGNFNSIVLADGADEFNLNLAHDSFVGRVENIGYIGSLNKGKGIDHIINVAKLVSRCHFHIIGGTFTEIAKLKENGVPNNITFHGFKSQVEIKNMVSSFDVFVLPNQKEVYGSSYGGRKIVKSSNIGEFTSPLKMFEYMSFGRPIICSNLPVLKEVLNIDCAIFASCDSSQDWVDAINILDEPKLRFRLASNAKELLRQEYSWNVRAKKFINFVDRSAIL